jgi:hypothetical protein
VAEKINKFESGERHLRNSEFQRQHYSLINQMLDLNLHESEAFENTLKACETIYGKTFEEMLPRMSMSQNLNLMQSILANNLETKLPMVSQNLI